MEDVKDEIPTGETSTGETVIGVPDAAPPAAPAEDLVEGEAPASTSDPSSE